MSRFMPIVLSTIAGLLLGGCAAGDARRTDVQRTDSAGLEIVRSSGADVALGWTLERVVVIDPENTAAGVFDPGALATDTAGRIHVLDHQAARILVFDAEGRFLRAQGRKGGGPGEANFALALVVAADGASAMYDASKRRLVWFGSGGEVLEEQELDGFFGGTVHAGPGGLLHDYQSFESGLATRRIGIRRVSASDTSSVVEHEPPATKPIQLESCGMGFSGMEPVFSPTLRWAARADRMALAETAAYEVRVLENGRETRRIRRALEPRAATPELAAQELGDGMRVRTEGGERVCRTDEVVEQRGFAPLVPTIAGLRLAPGGELWVKRYAVGEEAAPIDVFDADGGYLGTLPAGTAMPAAFLAEDHFVTVETDELDVGRVVIYRVRR